MQLANFIQIKEPSGDLEQEVFHSRCEHFFEQSVGTIPGALVGMLALTLTLYYANAKLLHLGVLAGAMVLFISLIFFLVTQATPRLSNFSQNKRQLYRRMAVGCGIGFQFGISPYLLPVQSNAFIFVLFMILVVFSTVAIMVYSVMPLYYLIFKASIMMPWISYLLLNFNQINLVMLLCTLAVEFILITRGLAISKVTISELQTKAQLAQQSYELSEANKTKDTFFSIIAHDLKSPIGSLSVILNDLTQKPADITDELYESIRSTAKTTSQLLADLLTWARNQRGEVECKPVNCQVSQIGKSTLEILQEAARLKGLQITLDCDDHIYAWADPGMLATVIRNLLSNAIKFTPSGGKIQILTQVQAEQIRVEVVDTGIGMNEDTINKLFSIDQKVTSSQGTNQETGTGLGLVLCRDFVEKNQGQIGVESQPGQGSRFWFTLPVGKAQEQTPEGWIDRLNSLGVLVVEDNLIHQQSTKKALEDFNLLGLATDGPEGVRQTLELSPDLVLMDIDLPGFTGVEAASRIRSQTKGATWIFALTSFSQKEVEAQAGGVRFDGYLSKPLDKDELMLALYPLLTES